MHPSCYGTKNKFDWYAIEFEKQQELKAVKLFFYGDEKNFTAPMKFTVEYLENDHWKPIEVISRTHKRPVVNTENFISLKPVKTNKVRVIFENPIAKRKFIAVSEVEIY